MSDGRYFHVGQSLWWSAVVKQTLQSACSSGQKNIPTLAAGNGFCVYRGGAAYSVWSALVAAVLLLSGECPGHVPGRVATRVVAWPWRQPSLIPRRTHYSIRARTGAVLREGNGEVYEWRVDGVWGVWRVEWGVLTWSKSDLFLILRNSIQILNRPFNKRKV